MNDKPNIRFKGFADAWKQCKLGEIGHTISGFGFSESEQGGTWGVPFYKVSDMNSVGNERELVNSNNYVTKEQIDKHRWKPILEPSVFFAKVGAAVMLNRKRLVKKAFLLDNNTMAYIFDKTWDLNFGYASFERIDLTQLVQVGALPSYNGSQVENICIYIPEKDEQEKIGFLLCNLDSLITLHKHKYEELQNVKKSLLQKMFPENNDDKPKIRFKGFTDAWEQQKLGECGVFTSNGVDKKIRPHEYPVNLLNYMDVYKKRKITNNNVRVLMHVTARKEQIEKNNVLKNDIFFTPTSETADDIGHAMVITETLKNTVYSYHLIRYRPFENVFYSTFPNFCFDTYCFHHQCTLNAQGVQRFVISKPAFENLIVNVPAYIEQEKIALLLTDLDSLITLHQRKYEKLQNIKKSLLERMFI